MYKLETIESDIFPDLTTHEITIRGIEVIVGAVDEDGKVRYSSMEFTSSNPYEVLLEGFKRTRSWEKRKIVTPYELGYISRTKYWYKILKYHISYMFKCF